MPPYLQSTCIAQAERKVELALRSCPGEITPPAGDYRRSRHHVDALTAAVITILKVSYPHHPSLLYSKPNIDQHSENDETLARWAQTPISARGWDCD